MNSFKPKMFRWLIYMSLTACSVSAPLNGGLQLPVHSPDRAMGQFVTHYSKYADGKIIESGYLFDLVGQITDSMFNVNLAFNTAPLGDKNLQCTGFYRKGTNADSLSIPLNCSAGRSGIAQITFINEHDDFGYGTFRLSDGSSGYLGFCGLPFPRRCIQPPTWHAPVN